MSKNKIYLLIIAIVMGITSVVTLSFAFIGNTYGVNNTSKSNVGGSYIDVSNVINFDVIGNATLSLDIDLENLSTVSASNTYTSYISTDTEVTVSLTVDDNEYPDGVKCNYNMYYNPVNVYTPTSAATSAGLTEVAISGISNLGSSFNDVSISGSGNKTLTNGYIESTGSSTEIWTLSMKFFNLDIDQSSIIGKNISGNIIISKSNCEELS